MTRERFLSEPGELVSFFRPPDLTGVEVLSAESSRRLWRWHHTTVSICTPFKFEGVATFQYRGRLHTAHSNGLSVMEPGEVHVTRELTAPATFRVLFVPREEMERAAEEAGLSLGALHFSESVIPGARLVRSFQRLHASLEFSLATPMERQERFVASLSLLFRATHLAGTHARRSLGVDRSHFGRARDFMDEHAAAAVGLDQVATVAGVSRFSLVRIFLRELGLPPHAYKLLRQVGIAQTVLRQGAGLEESARLAGFFDVSHLSRHFKRIVGVTPGTYGRGVSRRATTDGWVIGRGEEKAISSHRERAKLA